MKSARQILCFKYLFKSVLQVCVVNFGFKIHGLGEGCFLTLNIGLNNITLEDTFWKIQAFHVMMMMNIVSSFPPALSFTIPIICAA